MRRIAQKALFFLLAGLLALLPGCSSERVLTIGVYAGSYWDTPNGNCYQILDNAIENFQQSHPGVRVEYVSGIGTQDYSEWLAEQILKGEEPDLYLVLPEDFSLLVSVGALAQLDELMDTDAAFDASAYYAPCLQAGQFEGRQYALPHESVPTMMFVNRTLLEEKGLSMPENDWTWDDFYRLCQEVTDVETRTFGVYGYTWQDALTSNGASLFSEDGSACYLADQRVEDSILFIKSLNELNGGYTVTSRDFDLGNVAFRPFLFSEYRAYQPYPWRVKKYTNFQWDCVCMPAGPDGANVSQLHTMLLGISSRTSQQELAWEFAKLLTVDESVQKQLYTYSHGISPLRAVAEDAQALEALHREIPNSVWFSGEVLGGIMDSAAAAPRFSGAEQAMTMAEQSVSEMLGNGSVQKTELAAAQREINIFLNKS